MKIGTGIGNGMGTGIGIGFGKKTNKIQYDELNWKEEIFISFKFLPERTSASAMEHKLELENKKMNIIRTVELLLQINMSLPGIGMTIFCSK